MHNSESYQKQHVDIEQRQEERSNKTVKKSKDNKEQNSKDLISTLAFKRDCDAVRAFGAIRRTRIKGKELHRKRTATKCRSLFLLIKLILIQIFDESN